MSLYFEPLRPADMTAKKLVLSLMSVTDHERQPAANLVASGRVFGIEPAAMRMALSRLVKEGALVVADRGVYSMGPAAKALRTRVASWESTRQKVRPWAGDWLVVQCDHLGRTNKTRLRSRERALRLGGLSQSWSGLWVRPNNLSVSIEITRTSLLELGLDEEALVFVVAETALPKGQTWNDLWCIDTLIASYEAAIQAMVQSTKNIENMEREQAAKEALLVGQAVIRLISFDPLLPDELINSSHLDRLVDQMKRYNALGTKAWKAFYASIEN